MITLSLSKEAIKILISTIDDQSEHIASGQPIHPLTNQELDILAPFVKQMYAAVGMKSVSESMRELLHERSHFLK